MERPYDSTADVILHLSLIAIATPVSTVGPVLWVGDAALLRMALVLNLAFEVLIVGMIVWFERHHRRPVHPSIAGNTVTGDCTAGIRVEQRGDDDRIG